MDRSKDTSYDEFNNVHSMKQNGHILEYIHILNNPFKFAYKCLTAANNSCLFSSKNFMRMHFTEKLFIFDKYFRFGF